MYKTVFKFYIILKLCFFKGWGTLATLSGWELSTVCGLTVCWSFKVSFPPQFPFLVRFLWGLLGVHPAAYWLKMHSPLVCSLGADWEKETNSANCFDTENWQVSFWNKEPVPLILRPTWLLFTNPVVLSPQELCSLSEKSDLCGW